MPRVGTGKANPSESPEFTPGSNEVPVVRSLFFYLLLIVFRPFILFLGAIVLSVLLRFTPSDYPFVIKKNS